MPNEQITLLERLVPGAIGSIGALLWMRGPWYRRIALVILGLAASFYLSEPVNAYSADVLPPNGVGEGTAGFLVGLFSMSIVDGVFSAAYNLAPHLHQTTVDFLRKWLGLPPGD